MKSAALIVLLALAAPQARPAPKREQPVPFAAGEALVYDISWSTFLTAGTATVSVKEKKPSYGSTAYYIVAEGRPTPLLSKLYSLYYKADTLLDVYTLLPQRGSNRRRASAPAPGRTRRAAPSQRHARRPGSPPVASAVVS